MTLLYWQHNINKHPENKRAQLIKQNESTTIQLNIMTEWYYTVLLTFLDLFDFLEKDENIASFITLPTLVFEIWLSKWTTINIHYAIFICFESAWISIT